MAYIYDLTDTWNAGGTTFNGIKLNVTDSASAVSSKLMTLQTNGTEHFSVTKAGVGYFSGNVGIGTSSPASKLEVKGAGFVAASISGDSTNETQLRFLTNTASRISQQSNQALIFDTNATERMRILADGNVLVGRTTAYGQPYRMVVNGDSGASAIPMAINDDRSGTADSRILAFLRGGTETGYITSTNNTLAIAGSTTLTFQTVASEQMRITNTGNVGIGTSSPNNRLVVDNGGVTVMFSGNPTLNLTNAFMHVVGNPSTAGNFRLGMGWNVGFDGTNWRTGGDGANNGGAYISSNYGAGALDFYTVAATGGSSQTISDASFAAMKRMTIDYLGNVGINTSTPGSKLEVFGGTVGTTAGNGILIANDRAVAGTNSVQLLSRLIRASAGTDWTTTTMRLQGRVDSSDFGYIDFVSNGGQGLVFGSGATERMRIDASGNLLVGTTSTSYAYADTSMRWLGSSGGILLSQNTTSNVNQMAFFNPNGAVGSINTDGSSTIFATSSDVRLKHDIVDAPEASSLIDAMQVRSFKWNANNSEQRYGFVAQELVTVAPEAVNQPADPDAMMGVDYSKLVPMLVKELQSLRARVAQLEGN